MIYVNFPKYIKDEDIIWNPDSMFRNVYQNEWFNDPLVLKMIEDIDHSKHLLDDVFMHEDFGAITAQNLSGGVKTLILLLKYNLGDKRVLMSHLGDNCFKYLKYISNIKDIRLVGNCLIASKDGEVSYYLENVGREVDNVVDYIINRE